MFARVIGDVETAFNVTAPAFTVAEGFESPTFTAPVNTFEALLRFTAFPVPAEIVVVPFTLTAPESSAASAIVRLPPTVTEPLSNAGLLIVRFPVITRLSELEVF